jgi:hypothetical protein
LSIVEFEQEEEMMQNKYPPVFILKTRGMVTSGIKESAYLLYFA